MAFVYWIHLAEHTDISKEGYVGITSKTVERRFNNHRTYSNNPNNPKYNINHVFLKYGDRLIVDTLLEGSMEYCSLIEQKLRPISHIGWNISIGGVLTKLGVIPSEETRVKLRNAARGRKLGEKSLLKLSLLASKWNNANSGKVWHYCPDLYEAYSCSKRAAAVARELDLTKFTVTEMYSRFRNGWNPNEDQEYLSWLEEKKGIE